MSRRFLGAALVLLTGGLVVGGCNDSKPPRLLPPLISQPLSQPAPQNFQDSVYDAADRMVDELGDRWPPHTPILPITFVNLDDLDNTSALGRLLARQMASRFTQKGYSLVEVTLRKDLVIRKGSGQFILSQDLERISAEHRAKAVLVGNYTVAKNRVYVSAQLIRLHDKSALASQDFSLPLDSNVRHLLGMPH
ncbi:MAG: hypothetical protein HQL82_03470 [Magnetococcales bacterium]|nr:hypothetical protein [Magnetococcales bacterium]